MMSSVKSIRQNKLKLRSVKDTEFYYKRDVRFWYNKGQEVFEWKS